MTLSERLTALLRELVRNGCVNNGKSCNESISVNSLVRFFREYGIEGTVLAKEEGRDNLIIRVPGTDPEAPSLAFMGHTDVVPASAADWELDPFGGEIVGGELWGRGTLDMLNMTASQAVGFAEALKNHGPFPGDLLYIALADEEASGKYGARWLTEKHWDKAACDVMVSEIGGFFIHGKQGRFAAAGVGEKGVAWLRIHTRGIPGHGSIPYAAMNAIDDVINLGSRISRMKTPLSMSATYRGMAGVSAASLLEKFMLNIPLAQSLGLRRVSRRNPGTAKWLHASSRTTVSTGMIRGGSKINIIPDSASLDLDIRLIPGETLEFVVNRIEEIIRRASVDAEVEVLEYFPPTVSSPQGSFFKASSKLLKEHCPDAEILPILIGGATDGRFWRRKGTEVYGFTLFDDEMNMDRFSELIHGRNERVALTGLERSLDYYTRLPEEFFRAWGNSRI